MGGLFVWIVFDNGWNFEHTIKNGCENTKQSPFFIPPPHPHFKYITVKLDNGQL